MGKKQFSENNLIGENFTRSNIVAGLKKKEEEEPVCISAAGSCKAEEAEKVQVERKSLVLKIKAWCFFFLLRRVRDVKSSSRITRPVHISSSWVCSRIITQSYQSHLTGFSQSSPLTCSQSVSTDCRRKNIP